MILVRWVGPQVVGGIVMAMILVGGMVGISTGIEQGGQGISHALAAALSVLPPTLIWLAPLCCGVGAAMAMARVMSRGEDVGLAAAGAAPWRTGWIAAAAGLLMGVAAWNAADRILPVVHPTQSDSAWVWLGTAAYRPADGVLVRLEGESRLEVEREIEIDAQTLAYARQVARPRTAPADVLAETLTAPAQVERQGRMSRVLACGALAMLGWIPWVRSGAAHVGAVLALGLSAAAAEQILHALAAQEQIGPIIAAWLVPVLLGVLAGLSARR